MKDSFTADVRIEDVEQLEAAAALVLHYEDELARVEKEEEELVANIRQQLAAKKLSRIEGFTIRERVNLLQSSIAGFVADNPDDVFPDGKKTRKFDRAVITSRTAKPQVVFSDDVTRKSVLEKLIGKTKIGESIARLLKRLSLQNFVRLKPELDLEAIKRAAANGEISKRKLSSLGIKIEQPENVGISARS